MKKLTRYILYNGLDQMVIFAKGNNKSLRKA